MVAFCRIDSRTIRAHDPITEPDAVIVQDPTLLHLIPVLSGITSDGYVLVNTSRRFDDLMIPDLPSKDSTTAT